MRTVDFSVIYYTRTRWGRVVQEHRTQTKAHRLTCERYHQKYFASVCLTDIDKKKYENTRKVCLWHYQLIK